jgi:hypothetical protein
MAKSTNHTAHNQSYKNHRNGTSPRVDSDARNTVHWAPLSLAKPMRFHPHESRLRVRRVFWTTNASVMMIHKVL